MAKYLRIAAPHDGYRRAGVAFTKAPSDHAASGFNKQQLQMLKDDSALSVIEFEKTDEPAAEGAAKPTKPAKA